MGIRFVPSGKKILAGATIAASLSAIGIVAFADGSAGSQARPTSVDHVVYSRMVQKLSHGSLRLVDTFNGPDGLTGLVAETASGKGQKTLAWGLDGKLLIAGPVLDAQGQNLSLQAAKTHGLLPKPIAGGKLSRAMLDAPGFTVGSKGPLTAVFLDPNCIFCHKFWNEAYPLAKAGRIRVKVVPVGFLKPTSLSKAATILMQKDPATAWAQNEAKFDVATEEGGTVPAKTLDPKIVREIQANTQLLAQTGEVATPTIAACANPGEKTPQIFHGLAPDMLGSLAKGGSLLPSGNCS